MGGDGERAGVADLGQDAGTGPDRDPGHGGQALRERASLQQGGDSHFQDFPAFEEDRERFGQAGDGLPCRAGAGDLHSRLGQGGLDLRGRAVDAHPRGDVGHDLCVLFGAGPGRLGRGAVGLQQGQDGRVPQAGPRDAFVGGADGSEQSAQPVGGAGGVPGEVAVVPPDHDRFGPHAFPGVDGVQQVGQGAGGIGHDVAVAGVGLATPRVQVGESTHRQAREMGDLAGADAGHRHGADGGRPVDYDQDPLSKVKRPWAGGAVPW